MLSGKKSRNKEVTTYVIDSKTKSMETKILKSAYFSFTYLNEEVEISSDNEMDLTSVSLPVSVFIYFCSGH